jgi:hypothetical protein
VSHDEDTDHNGDGRGTLEQCRDMHGPPDRIYGGQGVLHDQQKSIAEEDAEQAADLRAVTGHAQREHHDGAHDTCEHHFEQHARAQQTRNCIGLT